MSPVSFAAFAALGAPEATGSAATGLALLPGLVSAADAPLEKKRITAHTQALWLGARTRDASGQRGSPNQGLDKRSIDFIRAKMSRGIAGMVYLRGVIPDSPQKLSRRSNTSCG